MALKGFLGISFILSTWIASHQTDTRAKTIVLTPKGKQLIKKAVVTVEQFDASFFGVLGKQVNALNQQLLLLLQQRA